MTLGEALWTLRRNDVGVRNGEMDCTVEIFDTKTGDTYGRCTCAELEEMAQVAVVLEAIGASP